MEAIFVLLGLVVLALPIAVVVLIIGHLRLRRQVRDLSQTVTDLQSLARLPSPKIPPTGRAANALSAPLSPAPSLDAPAPPPSTPSLPAPLAEAAGAPPKAQATSTAGPPRRTGPSTLESLGVWLRDNWFYGVAAVSLALAGIFLVQYGIETGLLTPTMRVIAALVFGAALIAAGETIRRRFGDDVASATAYLPSVLSGAGLVSLIGGVLAARLLYDLVAPGPALGALFAIALFGLLLGWRH
ncbi:unnamed protein product, partial [Ectocarpus sp. 12 AP-2014]